MIQVCQTLCSPTALLKSQGCGMCVQDWEAVVEYLMQRGEADRALPVLRRPGVSQELWYKFAPTLMLLAPAATVDAWMTAQPPLAPPR